MRTFWMTVFVAVLVPVVAGCSDGELDLNVRKWEQQGPSAYSFNYQAICYCSDSMVRAVRISVNDEEVIQVVFRDTQQTVAVEAYDGYPTVEGLFQVIRDAIDRDAHAIEVSYDSLFGYPTAASIDYRENLADDEFGFLASDLTAIE